MTIGRMFAEMIS